MRCCIPQHIEVNFRRRIRRRNIPKALNAILIYGSWAMLILIMFFVTYNDILKILN